MRRWSLVTLALVLLVFSHPPARAESDEEMALEAAQKWLDLVDAGEVRESWKQSSEWFRRILTEQQWAATVRAIRKPLGDVVARRLLRTQYKESLPGAPAGQYVVIEYRTDYERRPAAVEVITPTLEDGSWRIAAYEIR